MQLVSSRVPRIARIVSLVWVVFCGVAAVESALRGRPIEALLWFFANFAIGFLVAWFLWRLFDVYRDGEKWILRRFRHDFHMKFEEVTGIGSQRRFMPETITIHFKPDSDIGNSATLIPRTRMAFVTSKHPLELELRRAVDAAAPPS